MEILRLNTHGIVMVLYSRMITDFFLYVSLHFSLSLSSSSLTDQVITTGNRSSYTFNVTRLDNQMKYECEISNEALKIPIRLEQYLRVKCKHRRKK